MKIGLITIIDNINIGSILQAFALCKKIQDLGHDVLIIDYCRDNQTLKGTIRSELDKKNRSIFRKIGFIAGKFIINGNIKLKLRKPLISKFKITKKYKNLDKIIRDQLEVDIFMTGSDQVWNTQYNNGIDKAFFLDFTDKPKLSYACSIGENEFPSKLVPEISRLLSSYKNLSIRECLSTDYIKSLGFNQAYTDLDPTLLMTSNDWLKAFPDINNLPKGPYLLVYSVEGKNNDFIFKQAETLASEMNLRLIAVTASPSFMLRKYKIDKIYGFADARQFINLIANASFVVASSFHGTAFSINFNKQFVTINPEKFNIRIMSLLTELKLNDRVINKRLLHVNEIDDIDYHGINNLLNILRRKSLDNLRNSINSI